MLTVRVDSSLIPGVNAPIPLDALLTAVEPVLGQSGRIVTAVRINGVEEPAFREADVLARVLDERDEIDVETTPVGRMAATALDQALYFIPSLAEGAREVAGELRGARADAARPAIGTLAENLALLMALVHTADLWARQAGLAATDWLGDDVAAVERVASSLVETSGSGDWVSAADALEYDLPEALDAWQIRLASGRLAVLALDAVPTA
jgi:hypothetical protein